tara:strand:- start:2688 stop:3059 length:372 start_codon:yes stop_codon:yes gene_type:complete
MPLQQLAGIIYLLITVVVIFFQICLSAGAPWGEFTQGGRNKGVLPKSGRLLAALSVPVLVFMGLSITSIISNAPNWEKWTVYVTMVVQGLTAVANLITPSRKERLLWGPVTTVAFLLVVFTSL